MSVAYSSRVLYVDLSRKSCTVRERPDLFGKWLGGAGAAIALLEEECPAGVDPLAPEAPVVFAVGPLTGVFPLASKAVAMFKSPLTGYLGESHAGGRSAQSIRMAGYGAIVISGASSLPVYLAVHGDKVHFRDASTLWGMRSLFTVGSIVREKEPGEGSRTIMRIGRGGENGVAFASVTSETYRHFGRLGLGAVLGSKKVKALVVSGERSIPVADRAAYRKVYDAIYSAAVDSPVMKKYHHLGTAGNVMTMQAMGALPTRNLTAGTFEAAEALSGESLAAKNLGRRLACAHCPVGCVHIAAVREPYEHEPYFYKTTMVGYDWELIYALGSDLGIADPEGMLLLMDAVEKGGIDSISTGVCLAWATEALSRGVLNEGQTVLPLAWGDWKTYIKAVDLIINQPNDFYRDLARGVAHASAVYGGQEYALAFGGLEMPGYPTGPASYLGLLTSARHSHLCSAGYSLDDAMLRKGTHMTPAEIVDSLVKEESWRQVLTSLCICLFARGVYTPDIVRQALAVAGFDLDDAAIVRQGQEILGRKTAFKLREGFRFENLRLPGRTLEHKAPAMPFDRAFIEQGVALARERLTALAGASA